MKKILVAISALVMISLCAATACICDTYTSDPDLRVFEGYVSAVDIQKSTMTVKGEIDSDFHIGPDTVLMQDGNNIDLSGFDVGDYVKVEYYSQGIYSDVPSKVMRVTLEYRGYGE